MPSCQVRIVRAHASVCVHERVRERVPVCAHVHVHERLS